MTEKLLIVLLVLSLGLNITMGVQSLSEASVTGQAVVDLQDPQLNLYTEAVCIEGEEEIECHDEVFIQCGETATKLGNVVGNNAYFELDWEDPRT